MNTDDLLTSFDGIIISLSCKITNRGWWLGKDYLHTDQSFKRNNFECVQELVNLFNVNNGDATFKFLRGSHINYIQIFKKNLIFKKKIIELL